MVDSVTPERRSEIMATVRGKDTGPELAVRRLVHRMGYRYRLHVPTLPGRPDMVFPSRRKVIFVHGCFWHGHARCNAARIPKSRVEFWREKIFGNKKRDGLQNRRLARMGWSSMTIWECEVNKPRLSGRIRRFLEGG